MILERILLLSQVHSFEVTVNGTYDWLGYMLHWYSLQLRRTILAKELRANLLLD